MQNGWAISMDNLVLKNMISKFDIRCYVPNEN